MIFVPILVDNDRDEDQDEDGKLTMNSEIERNLGEQPVARIMADLGLKARDLVAISTEHLTHKMVARACKGRRLTPNVQSKIRNALNQSTGNEYSIADLFTYFKATAINDLTYLQTLRNVQQKEGRTK